MKRIIKGFVYAVIMGLFVGMTYLLTQAFHVWGVIISLMFLFQTIILLEVKGLRRLVKKLSEEK